VFNNRENAQLQILPLTLGPTLTNTYILGDPVRKRAVIIDPGFSGELILKEVKEQGWNVTQIWLTHAHFDHIGGIAQIVGASSTNIEIALHPEDEPLWKFQGGAALFGFPAFDSGPKPTVSLTHGMQLRLGEFVFDVRHTPGHSPGHVIFLSHQERFAFCGDLIFHQSVGRADLPGGNWETLIQSIQDNILDLPDDYRLFPGHGPQTTVGAERRSNPFLQT
jgi:hydroxyacylglutathione hydrolase